MWKLNILFTTRFLLQKKTKFKKEVLDNKYQNTKKIYLQCFYLYKKLKTIYLKIYDQFKILCTSLKIKLLLSVN